jgi:5-dehydro-2-deoxygluconokinase
VSTSLDLLAIGRVSVDLYGEQIGGRLEDVATFAKGVGGCPANVAIGAARLGLRTALLSRVGDEPMGRFVREQLEREGVDTRALHTDPKRLTSLVLLGVRDAEHFPLIFYRDNCADSALCEDDVDERLVAGAQAVLLTGTHLSLDAGARAQRKALALARAHGRKVLLDLDYRPNLWGIGGHGAGESRYARSARVTAALAPLLPECDLIVGTEEELQVAAGLEDTLGAVRRIRADSPALIVCKRGPRGCMLFDGPIPQSLEQGLLAPGMDVEVYNVLGAGDAFLAGFLSGYLRGAPHAESARRGNACGALAVSRLLCSSEYPTHAELEHYLAHGSRYRALREDPELSHLHRATTRRRGPRQLCVLEPGAASPPGAAVRAGVSAELERVAIAAVADIAAGREGFGVRLDAGAGTPLVGEAVRAGLWVACAVERSGSGPLELGHGASLAAELIGWPTAPTVACRCRYRADDPPARRAAQERELTRLVAACRAQQRELLIGLIGDESGNGTPEQSLARLYALDIRPEWWELEPQAEARAWERCAALIAAQDPWCRGIVVALGEGAGEPGRQLAVAAGCPLVRGFIARVSIDSAAARASLSGQRSAAAAPRDIAERFRTLVDSWVALRGLPPERLEGSEH